MPIITVDKVNDTGVLPVGEESWLNFSKARGNNPGYQGPKMVVMQQYEVDTAPWTAPDGKVITFINSAKPVGEAIAAAPSPYEAAAGAAQQRVTATAQRDATGRSIERQVCLKAAAELWNGVEGWSADEGVESNDVLNMAAEFDDWLKDRSVPPTLAEQAAEAGIVVPVEQQQQEPPRYDGDPGPGQ